MTKIKATIAAVLAAVLMATVAQPAGATPPPPTQLPAAQLPADVVQVGNVFVKTVNPCSCTVTIDGYVWSGLPYYDGSAAVDSAVEVWWLLTEVPGYVVQPAVTSISVAIEVAGNVGGGPPG